MAGVPLQKGSGATTQPRPEAAILASDDLMVGFHDEVVDPPLPVLVLDRDVPGGRPVKPLHPTKIHTVLLGGLDQ